jgi:hypothetical protein
MLASVVGRGEPLRSRWWLVGAPVGYLMFMGFLRTAIAVPLLLIFQVGDRSGGDVLAKTIATWMAVAILAVATARATRGRAAHSPNGTTS